MSRSVWDGTIRLLSTIAERTRQVTGLRCVVVIGSVGDKTLVGAQVPDVETLRQLLEDALASLADGSATVRQRSEQ